MADKLGVANGVVEPNDFANVDLQSGRQIHQLDGKFVVIAFVPHPDAVAFHTTVGTFDDSLTDTSLCDASATLTDGDCDPNSNSSTQDHAVVRVISCSQATCPVGLGQVSVTQDDVTTTLDLTVVGEPVSVTFDPASGSIQTGALSPICPFTQPPASVPPTEMLLIAHARDAAGTAVTGAALTWTTSDTTRATLASPFSPSLDYGAGGIGAANVVCTVPNAPSGSINVTATLARAVDTGTIVHRPRSGCRPWRAR